jgi:hypothetical protein
MMPANKERKMRYIKMALALTFLVLIFSSSSQAKEWRGIVPMHSTCEDIKRILGITKCQTSFYDLKDERVFIKFLERTCDENPPGKWNVPIGTVMEITVFPKVKPKLADIHLDLSKFTRERDPEKIDFFIYWNAEEGFHFIVRPDGEADDFSYFGTPKDDYLRCPNYKAPAQSQSGVGSLAENLRPKTKCVQRKGH